MVDRCRSTAATEETKDDVVRSREEGERAPDDGRVRVEDADEQGVDLVVMGTHGRTGRDRIANPGSTTERVVENGDHPVLAVDID